MPAISSVDFDRAGIPPLRELQVMIYRRFAVKAPIQLSVGDPPALQLGRGLEVCWDATNSVYDLWESGEPKRFSVSVEDVLLLAGDA